MNSIEETNFDISAYGKKGKYQSGRLRLRSNYSKNPNSSKIQLSKIILLPYRFRTKLNDLVFFLYKGKHAGHKKKRKKTAK